MGQSLGVMDATLGGGECDNPVTTCVGQSLGVIDYSLLVGIHMRSSQSPVCTPPVSLDLVAHEPQLKGKHRKLPESNGKLPESNGRLHVPCCKLSLSGSARDAGAERPARNCPHRKGPWQARPRQPTPGHGPDEAWARRVMGPMRHGPDEAWAR